ncbi:MAG: hypothetical protein A2Y72_00575 [Chloroflexi bacterium RBG_13_53_26]|nr:MAG: hypothetical protein A2Y72_00575 [Chloroflexi bacterium RBG_13_53_26]
MFCPKCGKEQLGDESFCRYCGAEQALPGGAAGATPSQQRKSATGFVVGSAVCAAIALLFFPPIFGVAGIVLGYFAFRRNRLAGTICMVVSGICMIVGVVLGLWVWSIT